MKLKKYNLYMNSPLYTLSAYKAIRVPLDEHASEIDVKAVCGKYKYKGYCRWSIFDKDGKKLHDDRRRLDGDEQIEMFKTVSD